MPSIRHRLREAYAVWGLITNGARGIMGGLSGWMGIMSLMEARRNDISTDKDRQADALVTSSFLLLLVRHLLLEAMHLLLLASCYY